MLSSPVTRLLAAAAALVALAVAAPAASADSIAYIKGGDVWLSTSDGSRQHRVTATGGYADVSQADDGTMIALHGVRLHRLDRRGRVLANFATPVSDTRPAPSRTFYGPFDPAISPDGTKVAYTWYYMTQSQNPTCFPPRCVTTINEAGTGYSRADRLTEWSAPGLGKHSGWRNPSWVDNDMVMISDPTHMPNHDVVLDSLSDGSTGNLVKNWFSDLVEGNPHVGGGDITRDRRKLAFVTGEGESTLSVYHVPKFPTSWRDSEPPADTRPHVCYRYSGPTGGTYAIPTFSPDGSRLAWAERDGIKVVSVPPFGGGCTLAGASPTTRMLIPGGSQPDWGPADVPAAAPAPPPPPAGLAAAAVRTPLKKALKRGLTVKATVPGAGSLAALARKGTRTVAKGARNVTAGRAVVRLRFTRAARRSLAAKRRVRLRVELAYRPAGGGSARTTALSVTLKR